MERDGRFQLGVGRHADRVGEAGLLGVVQQRGVAEAAIGAQGEGGGREGRAEMRDDRLEQRAQVRRAADVAGAQSRAEEIPVGEDEQRMEHVLVIVCVEEAERLLPVGGIVGRVDVQHELAGRVVARDGVAGEPLAQHATEPADRVPRHLILQPRERRVPATRGPHHLAIELDPLHPPRGLRPQDRRVQLVVPHRPRLLARRGRRDDTRGPLRRSRYPHETRKSQQNNSRG